MTTSGANPTEAESPVALVTGAGSGIGRAVSVLLSRSGYRVAMVGRRRERLDAVAAMLGGPSLVIPADVSLWTEAASAVRVCESHFGRLDALVNNAGLAPPATIQQTTEAVARDVVAVNLLGPMAMLVAAWPLFMKQGGGCVVNVSSMATIDPFPSLFAYAAAKAGVNVMARSVVNQCAAGGPRVRAFAVAPGAVETDMLRGIVSKEQLPESMTLTPEQVAVVILSCIAGERDAENGGVIVVKA